jgi:penicillin-binding protein 1A
MPIGANEVTVLDHTAGYAIFVNEGKSATPHAILEVRNGAGDLIWRFDRDGKKPQQVISPQVARDMNVIMSQVVEAGTARRAIIEGVKAAGKTGTTNSYRDAWFVGFTGNYIAGVWFGNDDYSSTNRMTGGSLPAQTWRDIVAYASQGVELKQIPGVGTQPVAANARVAAAAAANAAKTPEAAQRPSLLTRRGADILVRVERLMEDATRALAERDAAGGKRADAPAAPPAPAAPGRPDTFAASERQPSGRSN